MRLKDVASIAALRALLARDRRGFAETAADAASSPADRSVADQSVILIDRLELSLHDRETINLAEPRSKEAAEWDGECATVGGYLTSLLRDEYDSGAGWDRLADLSPVVVAVRSEGSEGFSLRLASA